MQITVQDQIRNRPELSAGVDRANEILKKRVEPSRFSGSVTAEWTLPGNGKNGAEVKLTLFEPDGTAEAIMSSKELADTEELDWRFWKISDGILQKKIEESMQRVSRMLAQQEEEPEEFSCLVTINIYM